MPTFNYVKKFEFTLILMAMAAVLFFLACLVRLCRNVRIAHTSVLAADGLLEEVDEEEVEASTRSKGSAGGVVQKPSSPAVNGGAPPRRFARTAPFLDFRQRWTHATLILGSIFYLRLTILEFKAFKCSMAPDPVASHDSDAIVTESLYLTEDLQTRCFEGEHIITIACVLAMMLVYTVGFPIFCFTLRPCNGTDRLQHGARRGTGGCGRSIASLLM